MLWTFVNEINRINMFKYTLEWTIIKAKYKRNRTDIQIILMYKEEFASAVSQYLHNTVAWDILFCSLYNKLTANIMLLFIHKWCQWPCLILYFLYTGVILSNPVSSSCNEKVMVKCTMKSCGKKVQLKMCFL